MTKKTTNDINKVRNEYFAIYSEYSTKLDEYNKKLESLDKNAPKDPMSEEGVNYRIAAIEKRADVIHLRTNLIIKYYDEETKRSERYHKIVGTTLDWVVSQFNPK